MKTVVPTLQPILYKSLVRSALLEDLGRAGDLTSDAIVGHGAVAKAEIRARESGRIAGLDIALEAFRLLDGEVGFTVLLPDGSDVDSGAVLASISGSARAVLGAERTALNILGHLCGIATKTKDSVALVAGADVHIACTRKTTPGLRTLEKYAVRVGGGFNHRFGLDDAVLIKDNHIELAGGSIERTVELVRQSVGHLVKIQVEVDTLEQLDTVLALKVDAVLLDNMDTETLKKAILAARGKLIVEISGGVTPENIAELAATGPDLISMGALTHSVANFDVGLDMA